MNQRSIQFGNRLIFQKQNEASQQKHLKKLQEIRDSSSKTNKYQKENNDLIKNVSKLRKTNKKRELINEIQFTEIERENRILLEKMTKIMKKRLSEKEARESFKPCSLNENLRKRELVKITLENQGILRRIKEQNSYYNVDEWEKNFRDNEKYLKNLQFYVPSLGNTQSRMGDRRSSASGHGNLGRTTPNMMKDERSMSPNANEHNHDLKDIHDGKQKLILFKKGVRIGMGYYLAEISIDKNYFQIVLDDVENPDTKVIAMNLEEGRELVSSHDNNYEKIISKIYFESGKPKIRGLFETNVPPIKENKEDENENQVQANGEETKQPSHENTNIVNDS